MKNVGKIRDEKLQYNISIEAANILKLLPFGKNRVIKQAKFTYYPLGKAF